MLLARPPKVSSFIIGADENGYGCGGGAMWVTAAAAHTNQQGRIRCKDSKRYSSIAAMADDLDRSAPYVLTTEQASVAPETIDSIGYAAALRQGYQDAVGRLVARLEGKLEIVIDGNSTHGVPFAFAHPKADTDYPIVSYASCLGKRAQVQAAQELARHFPEYAFDQHHCYLTPLHIEKLREHGAIRCVHRISVINTLFRNRGWTLKIRER